MSIVARVNGKKEKSVEGMHVDKKDASSVGNGDS
jgi:hypothetical protein